MNQTSAVMDETVWEGGPLGQLNERGLRQQVCLYEYELNLLTKSIKAAGDAFPLECVATPVLTPTLMQEKKFCLVSTAAVPLCLDPLYLCRPDTTLISYHINEQYCRLV